METGNWKEKYQNPPPLDVDEVAAASECTGLIPSAVETEAEGSAYQTLYGIPRQKPARGGQGV